MTRHCCAGYTALTGHLALGLAWAAAFTILGLIIFAVRTRSRSHHHQQSAVS
jgi:ABC-2 type transport system permease protein